MTPDELEREIRESGRRVQIYQAQAKLESDPFMRIRFRGQARREARVMAQLIAQRTPETVARMEAERGLA